MHCLNCNRKIPDGEIVCPFCKADITGSDNRCPDCWTKLEKDEKICPKCGINVEEARKEREDIANTKKTSLIKKIKRIPRGIKIAAVSFLAVLVIVLVAVGIFRANSATAKASVLARDYISMAQEAMEDINELALLYENEVYNEDWIMHIESARKLREDKADKIKEIKATREPMEYFQAQIRATERKEFIEYSDDMFYGYQKCYAYVVGEVGKYPHYYDNFKKLLAEYEKAEKELEKLIK